jgi:RNA polymerase sigma-70 factor (ECF subfamily)
VLDRSTLERLYLEKEKPLFNIAMRWTWNAAEAQELVQEAFVRVWARRLLVKPDTASSYVYRTVLNLCQKHARKRERWQRVKVLFAASDRSSVEPDEAWQRHSMRAAIESLPDKQRQVLLLTEYSDLKQIEIARLLGIPVGTVASRRNSAIKGLKEALSESG